MSDKESYTTAPEDRLSIGQKLTYGLGGFANNLLGAASGSMMVVLNLGLKMDPGLVGLLGAIPRATDAMTDPIMGYISDHTNSRWGRRRPYIFLGTLFCGLLFFLLWCIPAREATTFMGFELPELGENGHGRDTFYFWYFLIGSILFYMAYTVWATPWVALGYELTPDYHERTRVMGYSSFVGNIAWLITPWFLWFMQHEKFGGEAGIMRGATVLALCLSIIVVVCGVICSIFLRERFDKSLDAQAKAKSEEGGSGFVANFVKFFKGFVISLKFLPFLKLCAVAFLIFNGFMLISSFTLYVIIYYVCQGDQTLGGEISGWAGSIQGVFSFVLVIIVTWLGTRFGKKRALCITTAISVLGYLSKWWCFNPMYPWLALIPGPLIAFGFGGLFPLVGAMIADVCDMDELKTHERREGMFGSIFWWVIKVGLAAALAMGGYMLNWTGFDVELASQSEETLYWMRLLDTLVPALTSILAIVIVSRFEITEEKAHEIRGILEARRNNSDRGED